MAAVAMAWVPGEALPHSGTKGPLISDSDFHSSIHAWSQWQTPIPLGSEIPRGEGLHGAVVKRHPALGLNPGTLTLGK